MEAVQNENIIVCDECKAEFETKQIEFKETQARVEDKTFKVIYYKCPTCGELYVVCLLDRQGQRLQNKYVAALDNYRNIYKKRMKNPAKLQQKLQKIEKLKDEALAYQNELLCNYGNLLPEKIFV